MIQAAVGGRFEARVEAFPSGIAAQVGVRILDNTGVETMRRTSSGILEDPSGSGSYVVTLVSPGVPGEYTVFWDWDGGGPLTPSHTAAENLTVVAAAAAAPAEQPPPALTRTGIPHLALPFRVVGGQAIVNEQDTIDDVAACVEAVLRYPQGSRVEKPGFGLPDQTFAQGGADPAAVAATVARWEPRAQTDVAESLEGLVSRVTVNIDKGAAGG